MWLLELRTRRSFMFSVQKTGIPYCNCKASRTHNIWQPIRMGNLGTPPKNNGLPQGYISIRRHNCPLGFFRPWGQKSRFQDPQVSPTPKISKKTPLLSEWYA
ncbi:UNVERIFIED_CONTAM: hypothetical protein K2H54_045814 [Gekko kuhli]